MEVLQLLLMYLLGNVGVSCKLLFFALYLHTFKHVCSQLYASILHYNLWLSSVWYSSQHKEIYSQTL